MHLVPFVLKTERQHFYISLWTLNDWTFFSYEHCTDKTCSSVGWRVTFCTKVKPA